MPTILSPSIVQNAPLTPLTHARIGWQTLTRDASLSFTGGESEGFPADSVQRATTWERWKPTSLPASLTFDTGTSADAEYLGIAAHTLGTNGDTVTLEYSADAVDWTEVESFAAGSDDAIMLLFNKVGARYWRVTISGGTIPVIGVVYIGEALAMERRIYGGHSPGTLSRNTEVRPTRSETGQFLGRYIRRQGYGTSYDWDNLTPAWYRANFDPFVESARLYPAFISWYPEKYPNEVLFGWVNDDISPTNTGTGNGLMRVGFSITAFGE